MECAKLSQGRMFGLEPEPFPARRAGGVPRVLPPLPDEAPVLEPTGEPGRWRCVRERVPEYILCESVRHPDGTLSLRPSGIGTLIKFSASKLQALGFNGRLETLRRLARAGFIKLYALSPSVNMVDMDSLWGHLQTVADEPDFWDREGDNFKRYCFANGLDEQSQARQAEGQS